MSLFLMSLSTSIWILETRRPTLASRKALPCFHDKVPLIISLQTLLAGFRISDALSSNLTDFKSMPESRRHVPINNNAVLL
jgi:hypothetical protein